MRMLLAAVPLISVLPSGIQTVCHPVDNSARVLQSTNPNDLGPHWRGEATVGTASYVIVSEELEDDGLAYFAGELVSTSGARLLSWGPVYVLAREWTCRQLDLDERVVTRIP
jgi:hypothetical protein